MRNLKYIIYSFFLLLTAGKINAQCDDEEGYVVNDSLKTCSQGTFEEQLIVLVPPEFEKCPTKLTSLYSFTVGSSEDVSVSCGFSISGFAPGVISETYDNLSENITLVTIGNEPVLAALTPPVIVPKVAEYDGNGNELQDNAQAIKLNDNSNDMGVTVMSKIFNQPFNGEEENFQGNHVNFSYSAIMQTSTLSDPANLPRFIVRIYDVETGLLVIDRCIDPQNDDLLFTNAGNTPGSPIYYTGWRQLTLQLPDEIRDEDELFRIEFIIIDPANGDGYATVYLDNICNKDEFCSDCPSIYANVLSGADEQQAHYCIKAYNTVSLSATAIYHAGYYNENAELSGEVVLLPGEGSETGFECLKGSVGHFYIEICDLGSPSFVERHAVAQTEDSEAKPDLATALQIFPNPTNSELNILSDETAVRSVRMVSLDGKVVLEKQPDANHNKDMKLDVSNLSSGIYILNVETTDGTVTTHKIVRE